MIKVCKAICVNATGSRKAGNVCEDPASHDFNGQPCCWTHYHVLVDSSRVLEFKEPTPLRMAGGQ